MRTSMTLLSLPHRLLMNFTDIAISPELDEHWEKVEAVHVELSHICFAGGLN